MITITSYDVVANSAQDTICKEAMPIVLTGYPAPNIGEKGRWLQDSTWLTDASDGDAVALFDPNMVAGPYPRSVYAVYEFTDVGGCINIDSIEIIVYELPTVSAGMDTTLLDNIIAHQVLKHPIVIEIYSSKLWIP